MADTFQGAALSIDVVVGAAYAIFMAYTAQNYIDLARDYYRLYQDQRLYYYNNFQLHGEAPLNSEVFAIPFYIPDYVGVTPGSSLYYFSSELNFQKANFAPSFANHLRMFNSQDMSPAVPSDVDLAEITDDWNSYYFRYEEHKRDAHNARRYAQMMDSSAYGVKEGASIERGLAASFQQFDEANGQLVSSVNHAADGYFGYSAYSKNVNEMLETPKATRATGVGIQ